MSTLRASRSARPSSSARRARYAVAIAAVACAAIGLAGCNAKKAQPEATPDPATYDRVVGLFYAGLGALDSGVQNELAAAIFTTMTQLVPAEPAGWADLAIANLRMSRDDAAVAALDEARKRLPDDDGLLVLAGLIASRGGKTDEAVKLWGEATTKNPANVRAHFALAQELARQAGPDADAEIRAHLAAILAADPANLKAHLDSARAAARAGDAAGVKASLDAIAGRMAEMVASTNADQADVAKQLPGMLTELQAAAGGDVKGLASRLAILDNLARATQAYRTDLGKLASSDQAPGDLITTFLVLPAPSALPAEADGTVVFEARELGDVGVTGVTTASEAVSGTTNMSGGQPSTWLKAMAVYTDAPPVPIGPNADGSALLVRTSPPVTLALGVGAVAENGVALFDADNDRRMDVAAAGPGGLQLWRQSARGTFEDVTASLGLSDTVVAGAYGGVWAFDLELDGDLDLLAAPFAAGGDNLVLRNNGDGTWGVAANTGLEATDSFLDMAWLDLDHDGVNDVVSADRTGSISGFRNLRGGTFARVEPQAGASLEGTGLAVADLDRDGYLDAVAYAPGGLARLAWTANGQWSVNVLSSTAAASPPSSVVIRAADVDNNGAIDIVASDRDGQGAPSTIWLGQTDGSLAKLGEPLDVYVTDVADLDADGRVDLLGVDAAGAPVVLMNKGGQKGYHAVRLQVKAAESKDQRINTFAIGGAVEARTGRLTQKVAIEGPFIHIGLGDRDKAQLVRFTWPNGTIQPEFDVATDTPIVVEQRLKGSCPWLYAWDGQQVSFVTDVLWKSPLGLRLNAQDTAGVVTTQDWVKVRGDQLKARVDDAAGGPPSSGASTSGGAAAGADAGGGASPYLDLRVTGELWETHYWDWFSLIAVDHAPDTEVWVDERFVVPPAPLAVQATGPVLPVAAAVDEKGRDVMDLVAERDNRYLDTFALGQYQGLAEDHWVDLAIDPAGVGGDLTKAVVIAQGWLYPTDSSINVALGQGKGPKPQALSTETMDGKGGWTVVEPFIGFPAGKGKTMLIDLSKLADAPRDDAGRVHLRLRNSMEIYWDRLGVAVRKGADAATVTTATLRSAVMDYHGFSMTNQFGRGVQGAGAAPRSQPDTPDYNRVATLAPIWLDLAGWYTRYGPVDDLVEKIDDRYVIVNAGDEVRLRFDDVAAPAAGLVRDYVFQSDGWNKDGDFNTAYSATVHPLPSHGNPKYVDQKVYGTAGTLSDDPIYQGHRPDWETYHTRYVSPLPVQRALWGDGTSAAADAGAEQGEDR